MCGRFGRTTHTEIFAERIGLADKHPSLAARYNITPGLWLLAAADDPLDRSRLAMQTVYWGFAPSWADKPSLAQINARSETAHSKPFWRKAFHCRRCVIPADFYFEWARTGGAKQPFAIRPKNTQPFFFAGVWSLARNLPADHPAANNRTAAILTAEADASIADIHHRMPIALTPDGAKSRGSRPVTTPQSYSGDLLRVGTLSLSRGLFQHASINLRMMMRLYWT